MSEEKAKLYRQKCREYLDRALQSAHLDDTGARAAAIARLRDAHERLVANNPKLVETGQEPFLRAAMEETIVEYYGPPEAMPVQDHPEMQGAAEQDAVRKEAPRRPLFAFASGFIVAVLALTTLTLSNVVDVAFGAKSARIAMFEDEHHRSIRQLDSALEFLRTVESEVQRRQRENPEELAAMAGERFIRLRQIDESLDASQPKDLPRGSHIIVQADANAYKVLFNWPLCRVAAIEMPDLVDPKRRNDGLNCSNFGVWNEEGSSL